MTRTLRRDLLSMAGLVAAIIGALLLVHLTSGSDDSAPTAATPVDQPTMIIRPDIPDPGSAAPSASAPSSTTTTTDVGRIDGAIRIVQLTPGITVTPTPPARVTLKAAPTTNLPDAMPTTSSAVPDLNAPDQVAQDWLTTLCRYDYRQAAADTHQLRAQELGDTSMPTGQDPFSLSAAAWTAVLAGHLSSACVDITVAIDPAPTDHPGPVTARLSATQLLGVDDRPTQLIHLTMTRAMSIDTDGHWRVAGPITAN